jgi:hypothetical protein
VVYFVAKEKKITPKVLKEEELATSQEWENNT